MKELLHIVSNHIVLTLTVEKLIERVEEMRSFSMFEDKEFNIGEEKKQLCLILDDKIKSRQTDAELSSRLRFYKKDIESNEAFTGEEIKSVKDAFDSIIKDFRNKNTGNAIEKLVLFTQLLGLSKGNPLLEMQGYKVINGAWKNGSVEGYPVLVLLDSLTKTHTIRKKTLHKLLRRTWSCNNITSAYSYELLRKGELEASEKAFYSTIEDVPLTRDVKNIWIDSFKTVCRLFTNSESENITAFDNSADSSLSKIIVSGMGWSGSGAVYAYLREFGSVVHIKSEIQHLTGISSTKTVRKAAVNAESFRTEMLRFFGIGLLGYDAFENYQEYRTLTHSNQFTLGQGAEIYARTVNEFCHHIVHAFTGNNIDLNLYTQAINGLLAGIARTVSPEVHTEKRLLFDNIIKMHELTEFDYLIDSYIIPVYRDPRSNYVAHCRENVKFNPSVYQYIRNYRNRRLKTEREFAKMKSKPRVKFVQFEEFVTNKDLRNEIALWLGLDRESHNEFSSFKPWESVKNVHNYKNFEDQKAIRAIEKALPEYLWNKDLLEMEK